MAKKEKLSKYSMKQTVYRQAIIEELAMAYSLQVRADSLATLGFGFSGDIGQALIDRAMRKLFKISRYGSRRAKVYCARNMVRLDPRASLHMCKKRLHVADLDDITIGLLKMRHGIDTLTEANLRAIRGKIANASITLPLEVKEGMLKTLEEYITQDVSRAQTKVLTTFPHYTTKKESE